MRISDWSSDVCSSDLGTAINRLYGTARIGGTLIWATRFEEEVRRERSGAKASGPKVESFRYFANLAVGLCEGENASVRRVWADGRDLDLPKHETRGPRGGPAQLVEQLSEGQQVGGQEPDF